MNDMITRNDQLPEYLKQYAQKSSIGNVDSSDMVIPRIKMMQALSPELTEFNEAKVGQFWHTIANINMGDKILAVPIVIRKSYVLWAPRGDDRMILARANDGIHWDLPDFEFTVKPKGSSKSIVYNTRGSVLESGLHEFGTSVPGDPRSPPAASLTYNTLWYLPDYPELSPSAIINTRSAVKPMQGLITKIKSKPVEHFCQLYEIGAVKQKSAEGEFYNYTYNGAGFLDEQTISATKAMFEQFDQANWAPSDESADTASDHSNSPRKPRPGTKEDEIPF